VYLHARTLQPATIVDGYVDNVDRLKRIDLRHESHSLDFQAFGLVAVAAVGKQILVFAFYSVAKKRCEHTAEKGVETAVVVAEYVFELFGD